MKIQLALTTAERDGFERLLATIAQSAADAHNALRGGEDLQMSSHLAVLSIACMQLIPLQRATADALEHPVESDLVPEFDNVDADAFITHKQTTT